LGVNTGDLKNSVAPCVLAFAELHQRFYTAKVASERAGFSEKMPGTKAEEELLRIYLGVPGDDKKRHGGLYDTPRMELLKEVSEIIIAEARGRLTK